jgi:hypothetical protein
MCHSKAACLLSFWVPATRVLRGVSVDSIETIVLSGVYLLLAFLVLAVALI